MKALFYCHNALGIGHLARTFKLASALGEDHTVAVICGGWLPDSFKVPDKVQLFRLPVVSMNREGKLHTEEDNVALETVMSQRVEMVVEYGRKFSPDVLIVEMFPFGRKKFSQEIITLIEEMPESTQVLASVRDVLVSRSEKQQRYDDRAVRWLNQYFDGLLVHSDPNVISLQETLSTYDRIKVPIHYTGFVAPAFVERSAKSQSIAVVSAGGGRVGDKLIEVAIKSANLLKQRTGLDMLIIQGADRALQAVEGGSKAFKRVKFVDDFVGLLARSALSISQCGYNTVTDVLSAGIPAVFVPFETPTEDEQIHRARRFAKHQRSVCLRENDLDVESLVRATEKALTQVTSLKVDLNGVSNSKLILNQYLGR